MILNEIFAEKNGEQPGYHVEKDDLSVRKPDDLRKTKLTLKQINRLRMMSDIRKIEHQKDLQRVQIQYRKPPEDQSGLM